MLEPFTWMFKIKKFRSIFLRILLICSLIVTLTSIIYYFAFPSLSAEYIRPLIYTIISIPLLYILGYFWSLTENIIDRETDITASNIYCNDIRTIYLICLPDLTVFQYIWRGIASIIACMLMAIPYIALYKLSLIPENLQLFSETARTVLTIFFLSFIPVLLWNYARRNSIVSVWNLRKAIYIVGNYPRHYISRILYISAIIYINFYIDHFLFVNSAIYSNINPTEIFLFIIIFVIFLTKLLYFLFVIAYLIGTLTPAYEP